MEKLPKLYVVSKGRDAFYCDRASFEKNDRVVFEKRDTINRQTFYVEAYIKVKDIIAIYPTLN